MGLQTLNRESKKIDHLPDYERTVRSVKVKLFTFLEILATPIIFGGVGFYLYFNSSNDINDNVFLAAGLNIGLAGFFMTIGSSLIIKQAMKDLVHNQKLFGKYMVMSVLPLTTVVFAYAVIFLSLGATDVSDTNLINANVIMAVCSIGGLVTAMIMTTVNKLPMKEKEFGRIISFGTIGDVIAIMGFTIAIMMF
jgi:F0F1-type ATP synthase membrane subunit c/vacuolar-type H+-ATPase subunit K